METPENLAQEKPLQPAMSPRRKWLLFGGGLIGWYVVNGLAWFLALGTWNIGYGVAFNIVMLPANAIVLLVLALMRKTRWIVLGILAAVALNFLISAFLGMMQKALCFLPFFIGD